MKMSKYLIKKKIKKTHDRELRFQTLWKHKNIKNYIYYKKHSSEYSE